MAGQECGRVEYELWTRLAVMRKTKATRFVGWVTYEMKDKESEWKGNVYADQVCRVC